MFSTVQAKAYSLDEFRGPRLRTTSSSFSSSSNNSSDQSFAKDWKKSWKKNIVRSKQNRTRIRKGAKEVNGLSSSRSRAIGVSESDLRFAFRDVGDFLGSFGDEMDRMSERGARQRLRAIQKPTTTNNNNNNNTNKGYGGSSRKGSGNDKTNDDKNADDEAGVPKDVKTSFEGESEDERIETNRRRNFSLLEFTKRRLVLFYVVVKTLCMDSFQMVVNVLRTRTAKFLFSAAFFVGTGFGIRTQHAKRHPPPPTVKAVPYSTFLNSVQKGDVLKVKFEEGTSRLLFDVKPNSAMLVKEKTNENVNTNTNANANTNINNNVITKRRYQTRRVPGDMNLIDRLQKANVEFAAVSPAISTFASKGALATAFVWLPIVPLLFWLRGIVRKQNGLQDGKKKKDARDDTKGPKTTFKDVAGVDEAKQELYELVQMLRNEDRYKEVRHRLPAGCLLVGPPGTGKTLLARAVAGEAGVAFFPVAASEFVELFVGRGAARVRELFAEARKKAPCVVFIDELDAIGARRGAGLNEERDQTLNQMLVEMDGFNKAAGVLVLAATNRPDALDPALTRPGRLTRRVFVGPPTTSGRAQILAVHLRGMRLREPMSQICETVARQTPGFTGAELANACNEAALLAARNGKDLCGIEELMEGVERTRNGVGAGVWGGGKVDPSKVLGDLRARFLGDFDDNNDSGAGGNDNNNNSSSSSQRDSSSKFKSNNAGSRKLKDEYLGQGVSISQGPS